ncbi:hypothetical protein PHYC_03072 [Phycisphaerales bacterium]|nr:hypothetical protein PHYC_03072 [Phycisphaerales bacterium]
MKTLVTMTFAAVLACASGCVVEQREPGRGVVVRPTSPSGRPARAVAPPKATLPQGPVAKPAVGMTTSASVNVTLHPLGTVLYDGQALPLVSPDGRFMAVQCGEAPTWPTILAEDGAQPVNRTTVTLFDISGSAARALSTGASGLGGIMLGRAADSEGFLVEAPQRDGSRWIGKVNWLTGEVGWAARDENVNAHAVLTPAGGVLFARRAIGGKNAVLVLHEPGHNEDTREAADGSYLFPMPSSERDIVYTLRTHAGGTDFEVLRVKDGRFESSVIRRNLAGTSDPLLAHQMAVTAGPMGPTGREHRSLVCLSPRHGRIAAFDLSAGLFEPLAPGTVAAAAAPEGSSPGYFCTTGDSLVFVPKVGTGSESGVAVPVLSSPYVPRATWGAPGNLLLVGPVKNVPDKLEILRVTLAGE